MFNKEYQKQWRKNNPEYNKEHYKDNSKPAKKAMKKYYKTKKGKATYRRASEKFKEKNPEFRREYQREYRYKKRKFINHYKISRGCSVCGYNKCASALDFHHNNGNKKFNIGGITRIISDSQRIKKEIDKCIILCRNCHAELHEKERR